MSSSCDKATWLSYLTYGWINPLVETGVERQVDLADTPDLAEIDDTAANAHRLSVNLEVQERAGKTHPLLRAVVATYWYPLMFLQAFRIIEWSLALMNPLLLQRVLVFQEAQNDDKLLLTSEEVSSGMTAVSAMIFLGLFSIFFGSQLAFFQTRISLRLGSALRGSVLERGLKVRACQEHTGAVGQGEPGSQQEAPSVYNVISFDVGPNIDIIWILLGLWIFPFQVISVLLLLFHQVKYAVVPGLVVILVAKTISGVLLVYDGFLRNTQMQAKDRRMGLCDEGFTHVRTLQMLAWTQPFMDNVLVARSAELRAMRNRLWMQKMVAASDYSLSAIVTLVTLGYYVLHDGGALKASVALPVIALVNSLVGPF
eukprot:CAMPEP_0177401438 /NCGR_PEP_ID=MMETSP0368-20130122/59646_1 /TAXON_ID=447022 ORGANISM="Scrippsiella hangoei-like, Strain SHHI-4" /NCGR_SAMPLE_ID=MMETSP0368 /ASSEMBLY_ACC=CAM_ASM_000363 /LENGTH=369 /DNA_ID=CAMNT_0018869011 /DNA_START=107 /DNA_END=1213 /DNA_ORIENTATION=+